MYSLKASGDISTDYKVVSYDHDLFIKKSKLAQKPQKYAKLRKYPIQCFLGVDKLFMSVCCQGRS